MAQAEEDRINGSREDSLRLDCFVDRFEQAWQQGEKPALEDYLPPTDPDRRAVLIKLIHVDLERDLKTDATARVETYLTRYPELASDPRILLDLIASEFQLRQRTEPGLSAEEYVQRFPSLADELRVLLGSLEAASSSQERTDEVTTVSSDTAPGNAETPARPEGSTEVRYRSLRFHAKGGLGEVHLAEDTELHRQVALKRIKAERADDSESRRRFLLEAEITARLEHPGVVPVHGLLLDHDGQPCYAMRFIQGETMQHAIERFHQREKPGRDPSERSLALRELLSRFIAVCNTVAYAHSRGILHRDLKPANIMLGKYGETLVVDWGLAKPIERDEAARAKGEDTLAPTTPSGESGTRTGEVLGTPAYMSPEQAAARWDLVGPASDIYSLGATLYTLLTGQPAYQGPFLDLQMPIQRGEFPRPRQRKKDIPFPLEAICLKAMALRQQDRYPTAQELAADVEHWLADEPVAAYADPWVGKLGRWTRRHRGLVAGAAGLLVAAVVALAVGIVLINRQKDLTDDANAQLQGEQDRTADAYAQLQQEQVKTQQALAAEATGRRQTRQALDMLSDQVIKDWISRQKQLSPEHRKFLENAAKLYTELAQDSSQGRASREWAAGAYLRIGNIWRALGQRQTAAEAYRRLNGVWKQLVEEFPTEPRYRLQLAGSEINLGAISKAMGEFPQAEEHYRASLFQLQQVAAKFPADPDCRRLRAMTNNNLGNLLKERDRPKEAEQPFREALSLYQQLAADFPRETSYRQSLINIRRNLGYWLMDTKQLKEAEKEFRDALALGVQLAGEPPTRPEYRFELATSHRALGMLLKRMSQTEEAEAEDRAAIEILEQLAAEFPAEPGYRQELASNHNNLANLLAGAGRPKEAEEQQRAALDLRKQLAASQPKMPDHRRELAMSHSNLAGLLQDRSEFQEAEKHYRAALDLRKQVVTDFPAVSKYGLELAEIENKLGTLLKIRNQPQQAEEYYRAALALLKQSGDEPPGEPLHHHHLAFTMDNLAQLLRDRQEFTPARELLEGAARHHEVALRADPRNPDYQRSFRKSRVVLASTLAGLGDHIAAGKVADQLAAQGWDSATDTYKAACALAQCVAAVEKDAKLSETKRQELIQSFADQALVMLRLAISTGYKDAAHMTKDNDLDPVRLRPDFQALVKELEMK